jgi:hypothetical protein
MRDRVRCHHIERPRDHGVALRFWPVEGALQRKAINTLNPPMLVASLGDG